MRFPRHHLWAEEVPRQVLEQSIRAALVYNLIDQASGRQVGFARVVSDQARFAWLSDLFVLEAYRGQGLGAWLVQTVLDDPRLAPSAHSCSPRPMRTASTAGTAGRTRPPAAT
jgi:GNAT superfamily N-acetyltransferase